MTSQSKLAIETHDIAHRSFPAVQKHRDGQVRGKVPTFSVYKSSHSGNTPPVTIVDLLYEQKEVTDRKTGYCN